MPSSLAPATPDRDSRGGASIADHLPIIRPALILTAAFLGSRLLGLARDVAIGAQFGTTRDLDLYIAAFRLPDFIFNLLAGGALGSALVPVFARTLTQTQREALWRLVSAVATLMILSCGGAALILAAVAPWVVPVVFAGFSDSLADSTQLVSLVRLLAISPVLFALGEVPRRALNTQQHFLTPALGPVLYNAAILTAAVTVARGPAGVTGLAWGAVVGAGLYVLVQIPALLRHRARYWPRLGLRDPAVHDIVRLMVPRLVGQGVVQLNWVLTATIASFLPAGRLAALNYAWLLMMLPLGICGMTLADASFPALADLAARGRTRRLGRVIAQVLGAVLFLTVPAAVGLVLVGRPFVATLLERGSFDAQSTSLTVAALALYALGLPAHAALEVLTRSFYALHDTRTPVLVGVGAMVGHLALALSLLGTLGHLGLALSLSVATTVEAVVLLWLLSRRVPTVAGTELRASATRTGGSALVLAVALGTIVALGWTAPIAAILPREGAVAAVLGRPAHAAILLGYGAVVYGLMAWLVRSPELARLRQTTTRLAPWTAGSPSHTRRGPPEGSNP